MIVHEKSVILGQHTLTLSTGELARQATAAVKVSLGDTVVLVAMVADRDPSQAKDFFPLTVHYQERSYAAGKIPGGFFKREGRPSEHETLVSRLIDRSLRPLFPKDFAQEVQVIATVLSLDPDIPADIPAMIGASAAMSLAGLPFDGPMAGIRIGYDGGVYQCNPGKSELERSELDLVVAARRDAVVMVESEARQLSEEVMLGAILYGQEMLQSVFKTIDELVQQVGVSPWDWTAPEQDHTLEDRIKQEHLAAITNAFTIHDKVERQAARAALRQQAVAAFESETCQADAIEKILHQIEKQVVRESVLSGESRMDGRDCKAVRPIDVKTSWLPRTHGSAVFTRGETQAMVAATLGTERDSQVIDALDGERRDRFMLHYNFPAYSVGELGMQSGPKRREIGHGNLAKRALRAVVPDLTAFPYSLRVVSEITESNGSSSMATVCGASLALMDAGVPISAPVSGVAMGLIKDGDRHAILTDILGDEDHLGDMDFKVAGTEQGVTALQMDIKVSGINKAILESALSQAREGRLHILAVMNQHLGTPRQGMSKHAPRIETVKIPSEKIKDVIGKGGATIRQLTESTGVSIDIDDHGMVKVFGSNEDGVAKALAQIKELTADVEVGQNYQGEVTKVVDFGAFVRILPGREGLLHISQISEKRIQDMHQVFEAGQKVDVRILEIDRQGRVRLVADPKLDVE